MGGGVLVSMSTANFFRQEPMLSIVGILAITFCITTPNFMIAYGNGKGVAPLQLLCIFYVVAAISNFFFEHTFLALFPFTCGILAFWITTTTKFKILVYDRKKMGIWRREQLEKNKVRREVIKERKAKEKAVRRS